MKLVFDTNVYFAILSDPAVLAVHGPWLGRVLPRTFVSSVVAAELLQGAKGDLARRRMRRATASLERAGRIVVPSHAHWVRAGAVQGAIWDAYPSLRTKRFLADILIACSARQIGAAVVTSNTRDFGLIARHVPHHAISFADAVAANP